MANDGNYLAAGICGIFIVLCGAGNVITGIVWIAKFASHGFVSNGSGLWSGIPLIIAGALGIAAWPKKNRGLMIGFLVMCIIACILASIQAIVSGAAHALWVAYTSDTKCISTLTGCVCTNNRGQRQTFNDPRACDLVTTLVSGLLAFIILSVFGALFTLAGSIIGCIVSCGTPATPGAVVVQQPATTGVFITTQSGVASPQQPGAYPAQAQGYPAQAQGYPAQAQGYPAQAQGYPGGPPPVYYEKAVAP